MPMLMPRHRVRRGGRTRSRAGQCAGTRAPIKRRRVRYARLVRRAIVGVTDWSDDEDHGDAELAARGCSSDDSNPGAADEDEVPPTEGQIAELRRQVDQLRAETALLACVNVSLQQCVDRETAFIHAQRAAIARNQARHDPPAAAIHHQPPSSSPSAVTQPRAALVAASPSRAVAVASRSLPSP